MFVAPRKEIRLTSEDYIGRGIYFVTICSEGRRPIFNDEQRCRAAIQGLERVAENQNFLVHAFCFMPDHAHFLVEGKRFGSNLLKFVRQWKQLTGYLFRAELPRGFWQRRFYDHILRHAEDSDSVAWYIWMNPVRKGIVAKPEQYPFSGSFTVSWPKVRRSLEAWTPPWKGEADSGMR
jgi:putative transposase